MIEWFALSRAGLREGMVWQLVTYMFLHGGFMHLRVNMIGLYFFGCELEYQLGKKSLIKLFLLCGVVAGLGWLLLSGGGVRWCLGASGGVLGIIGMFAALNPQREVTLLLFFVLPVRVSARKLALGYMVFSFLMLLDGSSGVAHAAHLFGGLTGYLLGRRGFTSVGFGSRMRQEWRARARRRNFTVIDHEDEPEEPLPTGEEVDAVLEKIRREGIRSLTRREREILARVSAEMRRR